MLKRSRDSMPVHLPCVIRTGCLTGYVFRDFGFTLKVFIRSWLLEIHIPHPDLTFPGGLTAKER